MRILFSVDPFRILALLFFFWFVQFPIVSRAQTNIDCYKMSAKCKGKGGYSSPTSNNQVRINPSNVPTEKGIGLEGIFFKEEVDVLIVRGTGRIGAAISPSNSEETFFGPPGLELAPDLYQRKLLSKKYPNQKVTLATAFNLIDKQGSGLDSMTLNVGLMARYNKLSKNINPGAGASGTLGPLTFGASYYKDETVLDDLTLPTASSTLNKYQVQTYSGGLYLSSLIVDYSSLFLHFDDGSVSSVRLATASLLLKKFILTVSERTEDSSRLWYNYETEQLETKKIKSELFGGIQYSFSKNVIGGILYNYYLLHEYSVAVTIFF